MGGDGLSKLKESQGEMLQAAWELFFEAFLGSQ